MYIAIILFFLLRKKKSSDQKGSETNDQQKSTLVDSVETETKDPITEDVLNQDYNEINSQPRFDMSDPLLSDPKPKGDFTSC